MEVTVIVATYGAPSWQRTARRAIRSAEAEGVPVIAHHGANLADARNHGAELADTEWLCFLDADDELEPGYFTAMAHATGDLRAPSVRYWKNNRPHGPVKQFPACDLTDGNYMVIGTLVRRGLFLEVGGFRDWPLYEDWCLWQRCHLAGATIEQVNDAVYRAHVRPRSRNRAPQRAERLHWHHEIRRTNYPHLYDQVDA